MVFPAKPLKLQPYYVITKSTLQSSKKTSIRNPSIGPDYTLLRKDRIQEGGGVLIAVHIYLYEEIDCN